MAEIRATTKLDSRGFEVGAGKMKKSIGGLSSSLKMLGGNIAAAFSVGAIVNLARQTIAFGSTISDLANQAGLTTDQFQALELTALEAGVSQDKIRTAMSKLNVVMGQAKRGMKTYVDLFKEVGITQEELIQMDPAQVFERLASTMANAKRGSSEFGAALEILGTRSGAQLIEVFQKLDKEGLDGLVNKFKATGEIIDSSIIKNLDQAEDTLQRFQRSTKVVMANVINFFDKAGSQVGRFFSILFDKGGFEKIGIADVKSQLKSKAESEIQTEKQKQREIDSLRQKQIEREVSDSFDAAVAKFEAEEKEQKKLAKNKLKKEEELAKKVAAAKKRFEGLESGASREEADRLARIGGTFGGAVSQEAQLARQRLELDKKRNDYLSNLAPEIRRALEESGGLL